MSDFDLLALANSARDALLADPFFSAIPAASGTQLVISDDPHDIVTEIDKTLNSIGLGLVVLPISAMRGNASLPKPYFNQIPVIVKIWENPTVNRSASNNGGNNPTAFDAAMNVARVLHYFQPNGVDEMFTTEEIQFVADNDFLCYQVSFLTKAGINYTQAQIAPVVPSSTTPGTQTITLSCATTGAAIFYTLGTPGLTAYPAPRESSAQLYTGPISVTAGQQLRARAWLAGYAPTNPAEISQQY